MAKLTTLKSDFGFLEGPVIAQNGEVFFTAIDRGIIQRIAGDAAGQFVTTGGGPNGLVEGPDGTFFVAQNGGAWPAINETKAVAGVQKIDRSGNVTSLVTGMRSPNDLAFGPDGFLYVTDPTRKPERDQGQVWRCDVKTGRSELILSCDWYPNGIGFSKENDCIYIADTRHSRIVRIPLSGAKSPKDVETVIQMTAKHPDGFAFDVDNNIVIASPGREGEAGNIQTWTLEGKLLDIVEPGTSRFYTNLAIGSDRKVYVTDSDGGRVLTGIWPIAGLPLHPFRRT